MPSILKPVRAEVRADTLINILRQANLPPAQLSDYLCTIFHIALSLLFQYTKAAGRG